MRKILFFLLATLAAGAAQAQIKCWNEGSRRVCGDAPPAGAKVTTLKAPSAPAGPAATSRDPASKTTKSGPLAPAEQEQEYRKRQAEERKAAEKQAAETQSAELKRENCSRAQEAVRTLESGRVARIDAKGERYFLDDAQIAQETAKARQVAQDSCN